MATALAATMHLMLFRGHWHPDWTSQWHCRTSITTSHQERHVDNSENKQYKIAQCNNAFVDDCDMWTTSCTCSARSVKSHYEHTPDGYRSSSGSPASRKLQRN